MPMPPSMPSMHAATTGSILDTYESEEKWVDGVVES